MSQEGAQQGDPLGPLLFCLALHPLLLSLQSELIIGYIDDITVGGPKSVVTRDVEFIIEAGVNFGLLLNAFKCELITSAEPEQDCIFNSFTIIKLSEASLSGAPLFSGTVLDNALKRRHDDFVCLSANIRSVYAHDVLLIMKFSLSTPKILHLLRCSPCQGHPLLSEIDELFRLNICHKAHVNLTEMQWTLASPPSRNGGLGVRRASSLALPAFLASSCSTRILQDCILMSTATSNSHYFEQYVSLWSSNYGFSVPLDADAHSQLYWDKPNVDAEFANLCCQYQIHLTERVFLLCRHVTAVIGYTLCQSPRVVYDSKMKTFVWPLGFGSAPNFASHIIVLTVLWLMLLANSLSCKLSASKHARPNVINNLIARAITLADIPCVKEPQGLSIEMTESDRME